MLRINSFEMLNYLKLTINSKQQSVFRVELCYQVISAQLKSSKALYDGEGSNRNPKLLSQFLFSPY